MSRERDEHIERLVERAKRDRQAQAKPSVSRARVTKSTEMSRGSTVGKNGRQMVEPTSGVRRAAQPKKMGAPPLSKGTPSTSAPKSTPPREPRESELHIWISLLLFFVAGYLMLCCVSYLIYWEQDADLAYFSRFFDFNAGVAQNWGGKLGAVLAQLIMGRWVGIMGLLIPVVFAIAALKMLKIPTLELRKAIRSTLAVMLIGSFVLGHFAGFDPAVFGSGWGGESGIYISQWLTNVLGSEGTSLVVVFATLAVLYFTNARWMRKAGRAVREYFERRKARRIEVARRAAEAAAAEREARAAQIEANRASMLAAQAIVPLVAAAAEVELIAPVEQTVQAVVSRSEPEPQNEPELDPIPETDTEPMAEQPIEVADYSNQLIELEGNQWGYVYDYDFGGNPIYCYIDKASLAVSAPTAQSPQFVKAPPVEPAVDEDDIEFTVHTNSEELSTAPVEPELPKVEPVQAAPAVSPLDFKVDKAPEEEKLAATDINTMALYDPTAELPSYRRPMVELLKDHTQKVTVTPEELKENKDRIVHTLSTFGIKIDTIKATIGPTVTLYEIVPAPGVRISKIKNLEDDIALTLSALGIRIIAPIPGKGTIGIEVPNQEKETVSMYSVIRSAKFQDMKAELPVALGKTIQNETFVLDLTKMPHLLVAGATGQGKSVGLNAIITSLLYKKHPSELKFILVDPKKVELTLYAKLEKHFLAKMEGEDEAIITDTQKVIYTLNAVCKEMDDRYTLLKAASVRNIVEYNDKFIHRRLNPEKGHRFLPYFVVIIDEFADLIMTAGREIEMPIARIAQLARAVGIHLIIATQRPTTNIITGVIKANFPARIAFRVSSMVDSRTILDSPGANQLIGRGDMLVSTGNETTRVQCAFIDTPEVDDITEFISSQRGYVSAYELPEFVPESEQGPTRELDNGKRDPLFEEVARFVVGSQSGSASTIQRRFSIGFNRAGRLIDQLEAVGIVGRQEGSKPRQVLISDPISLEMLLDN